MIKIRNLSHNYAGGRKINFPDWDIDSMDQWLLLGASGKGKSTLLNILAGLLSPTQGTVMHNELNLHSLSGTALDRFRGRHIGIVFQQSHLIKALNAIQNLQIASSLAGLTFDDAHAMNLLKDLGIEELKKKYPHELSQGQLQRLSVARALINKPDLLIADEPTSSLDDENAFQVLEMLQTQAKNNQAAHVIATHDQRVSQRIDKSYLL
jgi:putative ABC transport system ATP-binding protein